MMYEIATSVERRSRASEHLHVKVFSDKLPELVESRIKEWLHLHRVKIHHIGQSQSEKGGNFLFVISLFYEFDY